MRAHEQRFSTGISRCARRGERRWSRPVLMVLVAAVVVWMLSGCQGDKFEVSSLKFQVPQMARWVEGAVIGLVGFGIIALTWLAALKVRANDEAALERLGKAYEGEMEGEVVRVPELRPGVATSLPEDPLVDLEGRVGLDSESLIRIIDALLKQAQGAAEWVESARKTVCTHEVEDMLRMALRDLEPVVSCLKALEMTVKRFGNPREAVAPDRKLCESMGRRIADLETLVLMVADYHAGAGAWDEVGRIVRVIDEEAKRIRGKGEKGRAGA